MKVKEFLNMEVDVDVADNVCESLYIAFCGPCKLTEEGKEFFARALELNVEYNEDDCTAIIDVDSVDDATWKANLRNAKKLFNSFAGYCSEEDFNKWFMPIEF